MITFKVVNDACGWAVRIGEPVTAPCCSTELAVRKANSLADSIRRHGARAEVLAECAGPNKLAA
jgi:hypothetical protein